MTNAEVNTVVDAYDKMVRERGDGRPDIRALPPDPAAPDVLRIDPHSKALRRAEYETRQREAGETVKPYEEWSGIYDRLVESSVRGRAEERAVLADLGLANNNLGTTETARPRGEGTSGTRPDAFPGSHVVDPTQSVHVADVKSMRGGTPETPVVLYDTGQLRQQRDTAHSTEEGSTRTYERDYVDDEGNVTHVASRQSHAVVISHPDHASVRPSRTLGGADKSSPGSLVIHTTPGPNPVYRVWLPDPAHPHGGFWSPPVPKTEVQGYLRRAYID